MCVINKKTIKRSKEISKERHWHLTSPNVNYQYFVFQPKCNLYFVFYIRLTLYKSKDDNTKRKFVMRNGIWLVFLANFSNMHCGIDWENVKTLKVDERMFKRKVREAYEIQLQVTSPHSENSLNQDNGQYVTTRFWKPMFSYLCVKTARLTSSPDIYFQ